MAIARWKDLCIDATDGHLIGRFWGEVLGLDVELDDDGDAALRGERPEQTIWVNAVPEPRTVKQRVHLDLEAASLDPILELGATLLRPSSESSFAWELLADPEGGELCVFLRDGFPADPPGRLCEMIVDTADTASARAQADWWAAVLGGKAVDDERGFSFVQDVPGLPFDAIVLIPVPEPKTVKNRIHWDITTDDVGALVEQGATVQAEPTDQTRWHVLQDKEGNEFCAFEPS
jgi:Glyoxalase-like domain